MTFPAGWMAAQLPPLSPGAPPPSCFGFRGGRALGRLHFLGLQLLSFSETELPSGGDRPHCATGPGLWERERESRMPEGVGTAWLRKSGRRLAPAAGGGRLSEEWGEPFPHDRCVTLRSHSVSCQDSGHLEGEVYGSDLHLQPWRRQIC